MKCLKNNIKIIAGVVFVAVIAGIIAIVIATYQPPIQRKLIGFWNIEFEKSAWDRVNEYDMGTIIYIKSKDTIDLPHLTVLFEGFQGKTFLKDDIFADEEMLEKYRTHNYEISQKSIGIWEVISINPDSVFFNAPQHPLHGKYAVRFFIDNDGYRSEYYNLNMPRNIYKIELTNDSTRLICNKGGAMFDTELRDWEGKN
ncbi:MAG: hypothetical protein LBV75_03070 [Paludibacter sp.]|jgi:uncharacterized protein (DUF2141 family)|nr:hypothetical protein [Paludibacter sp.]